jgi:hypothetical protein
VLRWGLKMGMIYAATSSLDRRGRMTSCGAHRGSGGDLATLKAAAAKLWLASPWLPASAPTHSAILALLEHHDDVPGLGNIRLAALGVTTAS